jgi:ABC-type Mn2+/Zn2+ transport system ATPase subunit
VPVTVALDDVTFGYGAEPILEHATLALRGGEVVVIAGPNGSGKSTLLKLCVGLLTPWSGTIRVLDESPTDPSVRRRIGYAPQRLRGATSLPVSVGEVVASGLVPQKRLFQRLGADDWSRVAGALEAVDLADLSRECMFELSGGQQQRAVLARALVSNPPLILLDEPTTGIDQRFRPVIAQGLRTRADQGATVVVVSHDPEDFHNVIDRIIDLSDERIRELTHDEVHTMMDGAH